MTPQVDEPPLSFARDVRCADGVVLWVTRRHVTSAKSFFSRIRRAEIGMHHHAVGPYLEAYAKEMAWREDARRIDNGTRCC